MDKFLIKKPKLHSSKGTIEATTSDVKKKSIELNLDNLPSDPGLRPPISSYHVNEQDLIRRAYLQKGPCQPQLNEFPWSEFGSKRRRFNKDWYTIYTEWLEYSVEKDAAFCLYCYLFGHERPIHGWDAFSLVGFKNWKTPEKLRAHIGSQTSTHNMSVEKGENLLRSKQHVENVLARHSDISRNEYKIRLHASLEAIRYLLRQGLAFRGHDETSSSMNQGNFLEFVKVVANNCDEIKKVVLQNAPENNKMTSPDIQKDLVCAAAMETTNVIIKNIGDEFFSILVDESRDISMKEQMAIVLRYVNKEGEVVECFLGIVHVANTNALTLKATIDAMFARFGLSISRLRGQGYDGATNMRGEFNGLKALILKENSSAYYIHCFAHQLQLALVVVANKHAHLDLVFSIISMITNIIGASAKRSDILKETQANRILKGLECGEITTGRGLNQERVLKRPGDTRWSSHFHSLLNLIHLYPSVLVTLETIRDNEYGEKKGEALMLIEKMETFEFVFSIHLMRDMLGISFELSNSLQKSDQDIVNAMELVRSAKERLQVMRQDNWDSFLTNVSSFCSSHAIVVPNMDETFVPLGRSRRSTQEFTNLHYYRYELFNSAIDRQIQELNNRFSETTTELLLCMACFSPLHSFRAFDKGKLLNLAEFYPSDFSPIDLQVLAFQLDSYIHNVRANPEFQGLKGLVDLAKMMVKTKKDNVFQLVYKLLKLTLVLPVATANVERVFSAMNIVKRKLRNKMGDQWLNNCLVTYIESKFFATVTNEVIMEHFQNMRTRRQIL